MSRFIHTATIIEATQWFKSGDHPEDSRIMYSIGDSGSFLGQGAVVRYFRDPTVHFDKICVECDHIMHDHGLLEVEGDDVVVCPGDWVITKFEGEYYLCKPDVFSRTYTPEKFVAPRKYSSEELRDSSDELELRMRLHRNCAIERDKALAIISKLEQVLKGNK